jgi:hypothetical protein
MKLVTAAAAIALLSVGGCALPSLGEAPPGYRAHCVVQPSGSSLIGPNSLRHSCREVVPAPAPAPVVVYR